MIEVPPQIIVEVPSMKSLLCLFTQGATRIAPGRGPTKSFLDVECIALVCANYVIVFLIAGVVFMLLGVTLETFRRPLF